MKKTPENFEWPQMEQDQSLILTPSEIGALSPRVPRSRLRKATEKTIASALRKGYTEKWQSAVSYIGLLGNTKSFLLREKLRLAYLK